MERKRGGEMGGEGGDVELMPFGAHPAEHVSCTRSDRECWVTNLDLLSQDSCFAWGEGVFIEPEAQHLGLQGNGTLHHLLKHRGLPLASQIGSNLHFMVG